METPLDVLSRAASLVHADDEKREFPTLLDPTVLCLHYFDFVLFVFCCFRFCFFFCLWLHCGLAQRLA